MSDINQNKENKNMDALFLLDYRADGVFIIIPPSSAVDKHLLEAKVFERVARKNIRNTDRTVLHNAVIKADGQPVRIADSQEEVKIDASLTVIVAQDRMSASLIITPPDGGKDLMPNGIIKQIQSKGIVFGVDDSIIQEIAVSPRYNENIVFAKGQDPVRGEDGKIEVLIDVNIQKKPTILEDGSVDFHELHYVSTVQKGQVLANITLPKPGIPGRNVLGQAIPAINGKPAQIPKGKNAELIDDGTKLVAAAEGQINYLDGKINVLNVLEIPGDVDISVGNIHFNGNVIVRGNVLTDFVIEATGSVEVHGVVEGAVIKAGGDIILKRGIQGLHKGELVSEHDIVARYIEHCTVSAKNDIKSEAIMHCMVNCGHVTELGGKKGLIVGGTIRVGKEIFAKTIGSPMATVTELEVGIDPNIRERYKEIKDKASEFEAELKKTEQAIELLNKMKSAGSLPLMKQVMLSKLLKTRDQINSELPELKKEISQIEEKFSAVTEARIKVQDTIYPGTRLSIGSAMKFIKENAQYVVFYLEGADIKSMPLH